MCSNFKIKQLFDVQSSTKKSFTLKHKHQIVYFTVIQILNETININSKHCDQGFKDLEELSSDLYAI